MNAFVAELTATAVDANERLEEQRKKAFAAIYPVLREKCREAAGSGLFWCAPTVTAADCPELAELYRLDKFIVGGDSCAYFRKELKALGFEERLGTNIAWFYRDEDRVIFGRALSLNRLERGEAADDALGEVVVGGDAVGGAPR